MALGVMACDNNQLPTVNNNPNNPTTAPAPAVFTEAARTGARDMLGTTWDLRGTMFISQQVSEVQYPDEDRYNRLQGPNTTAWFNGMYNLELEDLQKVIGAGQAASAPTIWAPATVLQVWIWEQMTDIWGNVPYSQALTGDSAGGTTSPVYDSQQSIYTSLFQRLSDAVSAMENNTDEATTLGSNDVIYGGDLSYWVRFGNSLRARMAMRIVNVDPTTANTQLAAALSDPGGVIDDNAYNAAIQWPGDGVYDNPWADNFLTRDDQRMSATLMNILLANNDPRIPQWAQQTLTDTTVNPLWPNYAGMPNGQSSADAGKWFSNTSRPGIRFYTAGGGLTQPSFYFTAAEMLFIEAEAAERGMAGLSPSQAEGFYDAAITASMNQWGITDNAAITAFLAQPSIAYKGGTDGLIQIATQKWVALFGDGTQAWAEWRRTCQPQSIHAGPAAIIPYVPRRLEYSETEVEVNGANVTAALAAMGGPDTFGTRAWWDTQPAAAPTYPGAACNDPEHTGD